LGERGKDGTDLRGLPRKVQSSRLKVKSKGRYELSIIYGWAEGLCMTAIINPERGRYLTLAFL
jgi:hypothetical protein